MESIRFVVVTGKGGVGRSAVAAAVALRAVRAGKRVLAVSMTESDGLAEHLGVETLGPDAHEVRAGLFALQIERPAALDEYLRLQVGVPRFARLAEHLGVETLGPDAHEVRAGLFALQVERPAALDEYLRLQVGVPRFARLGPLATAFDALASAAPGIREIVTMGKALYEVRSDTWDLVVADGPPTGQIGSHLRAPRTVSDLVPAGRIREQAAWMADLLADPDRSALVLVTLAEELPALETREAMMWLENSELIRTHSVITNRVLEPLDAPESDLPASGPVRDAALLHSGLVREQTRWLAETPAGPRLPYLFGTTGPAEVSERLADLVELP